MDLEKNVFESSNPEKIAGSVKRSAERSHRRKSTPFRSAMSMLNFYINRAGKNLSARRKRVLEAAKDRLRRMFHRRPRGSAARNLRSAADFTRRGSADGAAARPTQRTDVAVVNAVHHPTGAPHRL